MGSVIKNVLLFIVVFFSIITSTIAQGLSFGSAAAFNVLASQKVINKGSTIIQGNVGVGKGGELSGFAQGSIKGAIHINNSVSLTALSDLSNAYTAYSQRAADQVLPNTIGDASYTAGVYKINGSAVIASSIVLDANFNPNATFIFQISKNLQINENVTIALINGAKVDNVLWLVADDAVVGRNAYLKGNLVANRMITLQDDAAVLGRVMSINGEVFLSNNILSLPTDLRIVKTKVSDSPAQKYAVGDIVTFKIEVRNLGPVDDDGVMVRDVLPAGLSYVSSTTTKTGTTYDPSFGLWILDELKVGEVYTLTINARATMAGYIVNTATVAGSTVDENLSNNKSDADLCVVLSDAGQIQGPVAVCAGSANTYKIKQIAGATYTWTVPSDWVITAGGRSSSEITVKVGNTSGTISVTVNNICGASPPSRLTVEVVQDVPPKPGPISGTLELCSGKPGTYSISPVAGATGYRWTLPAGWTKLSDNGTSITVTTDGDATTKRLSVTAYNLCGDGEPSFLDVTPVLSVPTTPGAINGPSAVCATAASAIYQISGVAKATSYTWTVPAGWTIISGQGTTTITVKPTSQPGDVTVKAVNDCGESNAQKMTVTPVTNPPLAPGAIKGPDEVCVNTTGHTYSIDAVPNAKGYTWSVPAGWAITSGQNTTTIIVSAGTGSGKITVVALNDCGSNGSSSKDVLVTQGVPAAPTAIKGTPYGCSTLTATYTIDPVAGALSYTWAVPAGWTIQSGQGTTTITAKVGSGSGTISVKATGSCGEGPARTLTVQPQVAVPAAPTAISGPSEVCKGQTDITYSVAPATGVTSYTWAVPAGWAIVNGQGTTTIKVTAGTSSGNVSVTATNDCGTSTAATRAVTVSTDAPAAPGPITGQATVCTSQANLTYSIAPVAGATSYEWAAPGWTIISGQGTTTVTLTAGTTGTTITVTAKNSCGNTSNSTKQVQVTNTVPAAPAAIKGTSYGCSTLNATYTIDQVAGATGYTWTVPAGWTIQSGQGTTTITVKVSSEAGTISVKANGNCGDGPAATLNVQPQVTVPTPPAAINGPSNVCKNQTDVTYSVAPIAGVSSYNWTVPAGWAIVSGQGTTTIKVTAGTNNGNVAVTATNDCGTSTAKTIAVTVSTEAPAAPGAITGPATVCGGQASITYSIAPVAGATSYEWSAPGWTIVSGQGTTAIAVTAGSTGTTISVIAKNGCGNTSPAQFAAVISQSAPAIPGTITGTTAACNGKEQTYTVPAVAGATSYTWSVPSSWTIISQNNNTIVVKAGSTAGNISVTATNSCGTSPASTLAVTSISGAITGITGISGTNAICVGGNSTFSVPAGTNVTKYTWEVPAGWSIVSGQGTTEVSVKTGTTTGTVKLTASNDCGAVTVTKNVEINTTVPAAPGAITGNSNACSGSTQKYSIEPVSGATGYTWTVPSGWTVTGGQGTTTIDVKAGTTAGQVTVTAINACGNSSSSSTKTISVTASTPVAGAINGTSAICSTTTGLTYSIAQVSGATGYIWSVPAGWTIVNGQGTTSITVNAGTNGGDVKVAAINTCGQGANSTLAVTTPAPLPAPGPITGFMDACSTIPTTTYSINPVNGATGYAWEIPLGWTLVAGQGSTTITVKVTSTPGTIKVKAVNNCSQSTYREMNVVPVAAKPLQPSAIAGPGVACIGRNVTYTINEVKDASSYTWTVPATWKIVTGQGTSQITVTAGVLDGTVEVMANNGCGSSANSNIRVRVTEMGAMGEIKDLSSPCDGLKYMVEPVAGATSYSWSLPEGWTIIAGEGTNIIMVSPGKKDGTITVVAENGTCGTVPSSIMSDKFKAETIITIPNVFSPNNDGIHDTWVISSLEKFPDNDITILNRWGTEVFKAQSYKSNWTGDNLAEGTYYYVARVKLCDGTNKMLKGYVMIVRLNTCAR